MVKAGKMRARGREKRGRGEAGADLGVSLALAQHLGALVFWRSGMLWLARAQWSRAVLYTWYVMLGGAILDILTAGVQMVKTGWKMHKDTGISHYLEFYCRERATK